jgi:glucose/arabinose dehydrogenase
MSRRRPWVTVSIALLIVVACAGPISTSSPDSTDQVAPQPTPQHVTPAPTPNVTSQLTPGTIPATPGATPGATPAPTSSATPAPEPTSGGTLLDVALSTELLVELPRPVIFVTHNDDDRLYAVAQTGQIYVVNTDGSVTENFFLDIEERIVSGGERGLLGMAFHPSHDGRFYLNYTNTDGDTVISEFSTESDLPGQESADPESERILLTIQQPFPNHNGGMIAFGPDGYLYIGMGDGGSGGDPIGTGQSMDTLLGKMLRIDVNSGDPYGIPPDNPFVDGGSGLPEIWSRGWRNPWRFSFDMRPPGTGAMFVGDVGQGAAEEISTEPAGAGGRNYGWSIMEGDLCFRTDPCDQTGLTLPVAVNYRENAECASITGGYVYRGSEFPELQGAYVYSDYCTGELWAFDAAVALASGTADVVSLGSAGASVASFGEGRNGDLYVMNLNGEIYKLIAERVQP